MRCRRMWCSESAALPNNNAATHNHNTPVKTRRHTQKRHLVPAQQLPRVPVAVAGAVQTCGARFWLASRETALVSVSEMCVSKTLATQARSTCSAHQPATALRQHSRPGGPSRALFVHRFRPLRRVPPRVFDSCAICCELLLLLKPRVTAWRTQQRAASVHLTARPARRRAEQTRAPRHTH